jgi:hypothetical protein
MKTLSRSFRNGAGTKRRAAAGHSPTPTRALYEASVRDSVLDVERAEFIAKFDRLLALRGDPVKGLEASEWASALEGVASEVLLRAGVKVVRGLVLDEWSTRRKDDPRPGRALDAVEAWLASPSAESLKAVKNASKDCTAARSETFGDGHRVPQAARHLARACGAETVEGVFEALQTVEEELLARVALFGEYHRGPEQRRAIVASLKSSIFPDELVRPVPGPAPTERVPYNADGSFTLGQPLSHKKFGDVTVVTVGETWIEIELADGSKKRLAHKPASTP